MIYMNRLTISPLGVTESSRKIWPFTTSEALCVTKIWNDWLPKYIPENVYAGLDRDENAKFNLKLLLALAAPIPRAVQFVVIQAHDPKEFPNQLSSNNRKRYENSTPNLLTIDEALY